jgi:hypothetical protein
MKALLVRLERWAASTEVAGCSGIVPILERELIDTGWPVRSKV